MSGVTHRKRKKYWVTVTQRSKVGQMSLNKLRIEVEANSEKEIRENFAKDAQYLANWQQIQKGKYQKNLKNEPWIPLQSNAPGWLGVNLLITSIKRKL
jgi:hypothetical protein